MSRSGGLSPADKNRLGWACKPIRDAFGAYPYLVGSALDDSDYRDIDIRLILDDDDFCRMFAGRGDGMARLRLVNTALSALIQQASGLSKPIDFQIQPQSYANEEHSKPRNPLGMSSNRGGFDAPDWSGVAATPDKPDEECLDCGGSGNGTTFDGVDLGVCPRCGGDGLGPDKPDEEAGGLTTCTACSPSAQILVSEVPRHQAWHARWDELERWEYPRPVGETEA
jgi:hypothetical protein